MKHIVLQLFCLILLALTSWGANSETNFGGVGIDGVPMKNGQIEVRQIVKDGPAHKAGIKIGDIITHIDGKPTLGSDFSIIVQKRLRGLSGTAVVLKAKRAGEEKPLSFRLTRRQIMISPKKENK